MHLQFKTASTAAAIVDSTRACKLFLRIICLLSLFIGVGAPGNATAEESPSSLRQQIEHLFSVHLVPTLPRGATVTVQASFPYINPSDAERSGLPSQLSGLLLAETRAAFAELKIDLATASRNSEQVRQNGFDPCVEADLSRYVIAGQYQLMGDRVKLQYRICNQENASERWPQLDVPVSMFPGIGLKPAPRAALETWIDGTADGQTGSPTQQQDPQQYPPSGTTDSRPVHSVSARTSGGESSLQVTVAADRGPNSLYYLGETIRYDIRANQDCHVYVWNVTAGDNKMTLLFPNYFQKDNIVRANTATTIGKHGNVPGSWEISNPTGRETLMVWALPVAQQFADYNEKLAYLESNLYWVEPVPTAIAYSVARKKTVTMRPYPTDISANPTIVVAPIQTPSQADSVGGTAITSSQTTIREKHSSGPYAQEGGNGCVVGPGILCLKTTYTSMSPPSLVPSRASR